MTRGWMTYRIVESDGYAGQVDRFIGGNGDNVIREWFCAEKFGDNGGLVVD
jgi:hypothetical protein